MSALCGTAHHSGTASRQSTAGDAARHLSTPASGGVSDALQAQSIGRFASRSSLRFDDGMPALTRRRSPDHRQECWQIYFGDIRAGTIAERVGNPHDTDQWEWRCGFYPGSCPGEHQSGTADSFDKARADFERAWKIFLSKRIEADFQAWRDQRDRTERKYATW
jgi:hypothetical protein